MENRKKILIVDDQSENYQNLTNLLYHYECLPEDNSSNYGYKFFFDKIKSFCQDPQSMHKEMKDYLTGFFALHDNKIDLLIIDVDLLDNGIDKSGIIFLSFLRDYFFSYTPAMLLTKFHQDEVNDALLDAGGRANYYLRRPQSTDSETIKNFNITLERVVNMLIDWHDRNPTEKIIGDLLNSHDERIITVIQQQFSPIQTQLEKLFEQYSELEKYSMTLLSLISYHIKYDSSGKGERLVDNFISEMGFTDQIKDLEQKQNIVDRFKSIKNDLVESLKGNFEINFLDYIKQEIKDELKLKDDDSLLVELSRIGCMAIVKPFLSKLNV